MVRLLKAVLKKVTLTTSAVVVFMSLAASASAFADEASNNNTAVALSPVQELQSLLKENDKQQIFNTLLKLKSRVNKQRRQLMQAQTYQPNEFYSAVSLRYALEHLPESLSDLPDCDQLQRAIEYDERKPIEEFEHPVPLLWQVLTRVCNQNEE